MDQMNPSYYVPFSVRLRELRENRGLTQGGLASALGMGQSAVANYENGARFPDEPTLKRIASFFGVSLDHLLGGGSSAGDTTDTAAAETGTAESGLVRVDTAVLRRALGDLLISGRLGEGHALAVKAVRNGGLDIPSLYEEVLTPVLHRVGDLWERGEVDVFREHLCSEEIVRIMAEAVSTIPGSGDPGSRRKRPRGIVCASPYGEKHLIAPRMICDLFRFRGWNDWFLGIDTPTSDIVKACMTCGADILAMSATMTAGVEAVKNVIAAVRGERKLRNLGILVGGSAFDRDPGLWERVGADGYASSAAGAVAAAHRVLSRS